MGAFKKVSLKTSLLLFPLLPPPNAAGAVRVSIALSPLTEQKSTNSPCSLKQQLMPDPAHDLHRRLEIPNEDQLLQSQNK